VRAVLGLVEHDRLRSVDDAGADLLAAVGGQTVHEHGARIGARHQRLVHDEAREVALALVGLCLLSHGRPDIRVDAVRTRGGLARVVRDLDARHDAVAEFLGCLTRGRDHAGIGLVALRCGDGDVHADPDGALDDGVGHVVAVTDVSELLADEHGAIEALAGEAARREVLDERLEIAHDLARMRGVRQAVDDRHARVLGGPHDVRVRVHARHDAVAVPPEHGRRVGDRLAAADLDVLRREEESVAAELEHADLERDARARGALLEDHRERLARERAAVGVLVDLDVVREVQELADLDRAVVRDVQEVTNAHGAPCRGRRVVEALPR